MLNGLPTFFMAENYHGTNLNFHMQSSFGKMQKIAKKNLSKLRQLESKMPSLGGAEETRRESSVWSSWKGKSDHEKKGKSPS